MDPILWTAGQRCKVDFMSVLCCPSASVFLHRRSVIGVGRVRSFLVVVSDPRTDGLAGLGPVLEVVQVDTLVFETARAQARVSRRVGGGRGRNWQTSGTTTSRFARRISSSTGRVKMGIGRWGEASRLQEVGSGLTLRKYAGCARGSPTCPSARHSLRRLHYADLVGSAASRLRLRKSTMWCRRMWRLINFGIRKIGSPYARSATGRNPPPRRIASAGGVAKKGGGTMLLNPSAELAANRERLLRPR